MRYALNDVDRVADAGEELFDVYPSKQCMKLKFSYGLFFW